MFAKFVKSANESARHCTLRGQLEFVTDSVKPVVLGEVESAASIVKRFCTGVCRSIVSMLISVCDCITVSDCLKSDDTDVYAAVTDRDANLMCV